MKYLFYFLSCFNILAAEGVLTNYIQYSPFGSTQGVQVCTFNLNSNLYNFTTTRIMKRVNGGSWNEIESQQGASNTILIATGIGLYETNEFEVRTNATRASFSGYGYLTWITNGGSADWLYQITNGYTGVKTVNTNLTGTSNLFALVDWQLANGSWTFTTNRHYQNDGETSPANQFLVHYTNIVVEIPEAGSLLAYIKITRLFHRISHSFVPEGTGSNITHIIIEAHRPVVMIANETDAQLNVRLLDLGSQPNVNQLRYRNADNSYLGIPPGYSSDWAGRIGYLWGSSSTGNVDTANFPVDILMDMEAGINISSDIDPEFGAGYATNYGGATNNASTYKGFHNFTWGQAQQGGAGHYTMGGWYVWSATNASANSPIIGIGNGPMSIGRGNTWCGFYPVYNTTNKDHGFKIFQYHRTSNDSRSTNSTVAFVLFTGIQSDITNSTTAYWWKMTQEWVKYTQFSLAKWTKWQVYDFIDDLAEIDDRSPYIPYTAFTNFCYRGRTNEPGLSNFVFVSTEGGSGEQLVRAVFDASGLQSRILFTNIMDTASNIWFQYWLGDGTINGNYNFLQTGAQTMPRQMDELTILIMLKKAFGDSLSDYDLFRMRMLKLLYVRCLFDQDLYPMDNILNGLCPGWSLGTANMPIQFLGSRRKMSLDVFPKYTIGTYTTNEIATNCVNTLDSVLNDAGAEFSTPHYQQTALVPTIQNLLQLQQFGLDYWKSGSSAYIMLTNLCEHFLTMQTPVEVRFSTTNRYRTSLGQGSVAKDLFFGMLASGFTSNNSALAGRMQAAWYGQNRTYQYFYSPAIMFLYLDSMGNTNIPKSRNSSGYWSCLRTRVNTSVESTLWLINGSWAGEKFYQNCYGSPSYYLMGAPVGVAKNSWTTVEASGSMHEAQVTPTNIVSFTATNTLLMSEVSSVWTTPSSVTNKIYGSFAYSGITDSTINRTNDLWNRIVVLASPAQNFGVVLISDTFTNNLLPRYVTDSLNVFGNITGDFTAIPPIFTPTSPSGPLPSLGTTNFVGPGLTTISLTNAPWPNHASGGAYVQEAWHLKDNSNAIHSVYCVTTSAPGETNLHLRVVTSNNLSRIIIARTNATSCTISTNPVTGDFYVIQDREELRIGTNSWEYSLGTQTNSAATLLGTDQLVATNGIGISGGPAEFYLNRGANTNFTISVSSGTGIRTITNSALPFPLVIAVSGRNSLTAYGSK